MDKVVRQFSDASTAIRKTYKAMNECLGEGSFGAVYLFKSRQNPTLEYAVKIMVKEALDPAALQLAREEISILSMFDHPNIVKYVESYEDNRYMYIVMEYMRNATELYTVIENRKKQIANDATKNFDSLFPEEEIRQIMFMILGGLHHIHMNGVVHRDLKPENCLIDSEFRLRIIDFGLSKTASSREFGNMLLGTPHYLGPEVFQL